METRVDAAEAFLPAKLVWLRYHVTSMTLSRLVTDERLSFPRPIYIGRFRYWRLSDLQEWEHARASTSCMSAGRLSADWRQSDDLI